MLLPPSRQIGARESPYHPQITSASVPALPLSAFFPSSLPPPDNLLSDLHKWDIYLLPHLFKAPSHPPARHKTTARGAYGEATAELNAVLDNRREAGERMVEILLPVVDPNRTEAGRELELSEGTLTTPFFYRDGRWITPREEAGGCNGVSRRYALEHRLAVIGTVSASSVKVGETVYLGNGVRGFSWGVVHAWPGTDGDGKT
jgi:4-amino-4-deoxychorismate lyase